MKKNVSFFENENPISAHSQPDEWRIFETIYICNKYQPVIIIQKVLKKSRPRFVMSERFNSNKEISVAIIGNPISTARVFDNGIEGEYFVFCNIQD